jgi:acyl carrier protein
MRTTVRSPAGAVPPNAVPPSAVRPPSHLAWCRGPAEHVADPGTTFSPLYGEALARHLAVVPPALGPLGLIAYVTPAVHAILDERLGLSPALLGPHVSLADDLAADSLDLLEVVIDLESAFGIVLAEREIDRVRTVSDLVRVVARHLWQRDRPEPWRPIGAAA